MTAVYTPSNNPVHTPRPPDPNRCAASVYGAGAWHSHQCRRPAVNREEGHGWCRQHTPSAEQARRTEADRKYRERAQRTSPARMVRLNARVAVLERAIDQFARGQIDATALQDLANDETWKVAY
jgi:hypothetical protein